jgi:hypothetical protein
MWTFIQAAVVTEDEIFKGWNIPMTMILSPATIADTPASRMRVATVTFVLFSLIEIFPLVFICYLLLNL